VVSERATHICDKHELHDSHALQVSAKTHITNHPQGPTTPRQLHKINKESEFPQNVNRKNTTQKSFSTEKLKKPKKRHKI
jgi:hypothetical protein